MIYGLTTKRLTQKNILNKEGSLAGDASLVLKTSGTERSGFRLRLPSANLIAHLMWVIIQVNNY